MKIIFWNTYMRSQPKEVLRSMRVIEDQVGSVDMWCFSEANPELEQVLKKERMHTYYQERATEDSNRITGEHGLMVAAVNPIRKPRTYMLSEIEKKNGPHRTPVVMVEASLRGAPITVATTHLTFWGAAFNNARRKAERRALLNYLPRNRTVFGGDLNSFVIKPVVWGLKDAGYKQLVKGVTWRWHLFGRVKMPFWLQFDHIFSTPDLVSAVETRILEPQDVSDHRPMLVVLDD